MPVRPPARPTGAIATGLVLVLLGGLGGALPGTLAGARADLPAPLSAPDPAPLRLAAIARRVLLANAAACPGPRHDFGLIAGPATATSWGAPVTVVWPGGAAARAGLRAGDRIRAANAVPWSADAAELGRFTAALAAAAQGATLTLRIERAGAEQTVLLAGTPRCPAEIDLAPRAGVSAAARGDRVAIAAGLERLLRDDAELAFVVAHETAHVVLGHTAPHWRGAAATPVTRRLMEQAADGLAVELMARAGYAPEAAGRAWLKIADSRAALPRALDVHGPHYPGTAERSARLDSAAARVAAPRVGMSAPGRPGGHSR